jgi:hypothetical protein
MTLDKLKENFDKEISAIDNIVDFFKFAKAYHQRAIVDRKDAIQNKSTADGKTFQWRDLRVNHAMLSKALELVAEDTLNKLSEPTEQAFLNTFLNDLKRGFVLGDRERFDRAVDKVDAVISRADSKDLDILIEQEQYMLESARKKAEKLSNKTKSQLGTFPKGSIIAE